MHGIDEPKGLKSDTPRRQKLSNVALRTFRKTPQYIERFLPLFFLRRLRIDARQIALLAHDDDDVGR